MLISLFLSICISTDRLSYQCEAAVLLPRRTAAAGLLLTAALRGHCFSETAAHRMKHHIRLYLRKVSLTS